MRTVYFSTSSPDTKTGLSIEDNMVIPDWKGTELDDVHFFEIPATGGDALYGAAVAITPSEDNRTAHFKAGFEEEMIIHVPTKAESEGAGNFYGAVVAQKPGEALNFVIPAEQHPDAATLKDPRADFLVGYSRKAYAAADVNSEQVVDLYFDRVAALGRFSFTNFKGEGEKVKTVTVNTTSGLVGSAAYSNITWGDKNEVAFTRAEGPLTLVYGDAGVALTDDAFLAYFVAVPGDATLTSIVVETDQYKYTKTIENKTIAFSAEKFKNINVDLSTATAEEVSSNVWYKASVLEAGYDYLIVSQNQALKNNGNGNVVAAKEVSISEDNTIELDDTEGVIWTVANADQSLLENGKYTLKNATEYLYRHGGSSTSTLEAATEPATPKYGVWDYVDGYFFNISTSSGTSTYYAYYSSGWKITTTKTAAMIFTNRAPQELSFAPAGPFEYNLDDPTIDFEEPALSEHIGDVTYSSSDESKATVDANGNVTFLKTGQVTITATVAGDATHQAAEASYQITIKSSNVPTWYKADEIEAGETYLVVSHDYALDNDGTSAGKAVLLEGVSDIIQYDAPETMIWTATNESSGKFRLTGSDDKVIRLSSSSFQIGSASGTESNNQWSLNADGKLVSGNYYLYYSTSQSKWAVSNSASDTHSGYLYASNPGRAPRNLSFGEDPVTVTHDLATQGADVAEPTLTGDKIDDVTYVVTSDPKGVVASINATTGEITLASGKTGTVVITASADKTNTFKAESISYTLKVIDSSIPTNTYTKVTSAAGLEVGAQYLLVYEGGQKVFSPILDGDVFQKNTANALDAEITDHTIVSNDFEESHLTLESGYYLKVDKYGNYLYPNVASNRGVLSAESTASHALNITIGNNGIASIITKSGTYYLVWSTSSNYFSSNTDIEGSYSTGICLYKLDDGRQEQNPTFNPAGPFTIDKATETFTAPQLQNAHGTVTYMSDDESVATVDATSGAVTIVGRGDVVISATIAGDTNYKPATAYYELTVTDSSIQSKTYIKVTSASDLEVGAKYLLVYEGGGSGDDANPMVFKPILDTETTFVKGETNKVAVEISANTITSNEYEECHFTLETGYYLKSDARGRYIYSATTSGSGSISAEATASHPLTISIDNGIADIRNASAYCLVWSTSNHYFSSQSQPSTNYSKGICLYKLDDGRQPQTLSFSPATATFDLYAPSSFVKPTLSTAIGTVTYSSSDATIAEVDNSGNITGKKKGVVTITATAAGDSQYKPGSASYKLTVTDTTPVEMVTYYLASSIEAGKEYLIVSNGKALLNNDGSAGASDVTVSGETITIAKDVALLWKAEADETFFNFVNNGQYLRRNTSNTGNIGIGEKSGTARNNRWSYNSTNQQLSVNGSSSSTKYYLGYSSSAWSIGSSGNVSLYTTDPGSNPGGGDDPEPTTFTYTKISGVDDLVTGTYLIVDKTDTYLFNASGSNNGGYSNLGSTTGISKDGSTITLTETLATASEFVFTRSGDNLTIKQVGGTHAGQYMFASSSTSNTFIGFQASENNFTINVQTGTALIYFCTTKGSSNAEYLYKKSADSYFKLGGSGAPGGSDAGVYLYKKVENP